MKKLKKEGVLVTITVTLGILAFFAVSLNILALSDVSHDYVSLKLLQDEGVTLKKELPAWTRCSLEWNALLYGHLILAAFFIFLIITLLKKSKSETT